MRHTARPIATVIAAPAVLLLLAAPALADYPPTAGEVEDAEVIVENPEAVIEIEGRDWGEDTVVEITYTDDDGDVQSLGEAQTDEDGDFETTVTLPQGVDADDVTFTVADQADDGDARSFELAAEEDEAAEDADDADSDDADDALAATGAPSGAMALATALLTAGVLALGGARWRGRRFEAQG